MPSAATPLHITIVDPSGRKNWTLTGRAAVLVDWIVQNRQRINAMATGSVEFRCGTGNLVDMFVREKMLKEEA